MNKQANILFIPSSSNGDSLSLHSLVKDRYYQRLIYGVLSRGIRTSEEIQFVGYQLAAITRDAFLAGRIQAVEQIVQLMLVLPLSRQSRAVAKVYESLCLVRRRDFDRARCLAHEVAETGIPEVRARALQCVGAAYYLQGSFDKALPLLTSATNAAAERDPLTFLQSHWLTAAIRSEYGDHERALSDLENLFPLVRAVGRQYPAVYYDYLNSLAVEFGEVGRLTEAHRALDIALASPFAPAYPNWSETRQELEARRTAATPSIVAIHFERQSAGRSEVEPVANRKAEPERKTVSGWATIFRSSSPESRLVVLAPGGRPMPDNDLNNRLRNTINPRAP